MLSRHATQALQSVWVLSFGIDTIWKALVQAVVERVMAWNQCVPMVSGCFFYGKIENALSPILIRHHGR